MPLNPSPRQSLDKSIVIIKNFFNNPFIRSQMAINPTKKNVNCRKYQLA